MTVLKRAHGPRGSRRQVPFYGCMTRHLRGDAICRNRLEVPLADAEEAVLTAVENDVLRVEVLETSLYKAVAALQAPTDFEDQSGALREELVGIVTIDDLAVRAGDLHQAQQITAEVAKAALPEFYFHQRGG